MKNFNFMRHTKYALALCVAVFVMGLTPVHADTITISGGATFNDPSSSVLSGSLTTNAAGLVTSGNISIGSTNYSFVGIQMAQPGEYIVLLSSTNSAMFPGLELVFSVGSANSLAGYTGGALCSTAVACESGDVTSFSLDGETFYEVNSASATVSAPEPSTYVLLFSGLVGLGLLSRKRLAMNASS